MYTRTTRRYYTSVTRAYGSYYCSYYLSISPYLLSLEGLLTKKYVGYLPTYEYPLSRVVERALPTLLSIAIPTTS